MKNPETPVRPNDRTPKTGWYRMIWLKGGDPVIGRLPFNYRLIKGNKVPPTNATGQGFVFVRYISAADWKRLKARWRRDAELAIARGLRPGEDPSGSMTDERAVEIGRGRLVEVEAVMGVIGIADRLSAAGEDSLRGRMKALKLAIASDLKALGRAWRVASPCMRRLDLALHRARSLLSRLQWAGRASGPRCLASLFDARAELDGFLAEGGGLGGS